MTLFLLEIFLIRSRESIFFFHDTVHSLNSAREDNFWKVGMSSDERQRVTFSFVLESEWLRTASSNFTPIEWFIIKCPGR